MYDSKSETEMPSPQTKKTFPSIGVLVEILSAVSEKLRINSKRNELEMKRTGHTRYRKTERIEMQCP